VHNDLVNPSTILVNDSEGAIRVVNAMVNPTINIIDVKFDEELLANDEWLHMMQQKHIKLLCNLGSPLRHEIQVEENIFEVIKEIEEEKEAQE